MSIIFIHNLTFEIGGSWTFIIIVNTKEAIYCTKTALNRPISM